MRWEDRLSALAYRALREKEYDTKGLISVSIAPSAILEAGTVEVTAAFAKIGVRQEAPSPCAETVVDHLANNPAPQSANYSPEDGSNRDSNWFDFSKTVVMPNR